MNQKNILDSKEFLDYCKNFYELIKDKKIKNVTRSELNLPKLNYKIQGNYLYIENYQSFLKYCNRKLIHLNKFFSSRLGCFIESSETVFRIRGSNLKINLLKNTEKQFFFKEVLCSFCNSLETERIEDQVFCKNCQQTKVEKL